MEQLFHMLGDVPLEYIAYGIAAVAVLLLAVYFASNRKGGGAGGIAAAGYWLEDVSGASKSKKVELDFKKPLLIGRVNVKQKDSRSLVIAQSTVGRMHAIIDFHSGAFWLSDQNSTNGTFVNGEKLTGQHKLENGDEIMFHEYPFKFVSMQAAYGGDKTVVAGGNAMNEATQVAGVPSKESALPDFDVPMADEYPVDQGYEQALEDMVSEENITSNLVGSGDTAGGTVHQAEALAKGLEERPQEDLTLDNFIDDATLTNAHKK